MDECEDCGALLNANYECDDCISFEKAKENRAIEYSKDKSRFKWRHHTCADGFIFYLDGKEYTNLTDLKEDINKALK